MSVAAVVLAAGASKRLGRPKQDIILDGETLLHRTLRIVQEAGLQPVIVVIRMDHAYGLALQQQGHMVVLNDMADKGMSSSVRYGVRAAAALRAEGAVLLTCDQPGITAAHLQALCVNRERVTASLYDGHPGVPAYFPAAHFGALQKLRGDRGARDLLHHVETIPNEALALDIDTEADLAAAQKLFGSLL